ncbi:Helicase, C-terminal domain and P-loop containing nucleoside triphosphate hydrolase domain-containing protein [Strongyloides ratti]|uniref:Helicase, C-terminal domain and P-loop containing nucleoside triphosphate hydrolase domain-containing protein n=1 Tax=Strongyloides ratti TaxID=34506 RepID=A0A090KTY6_STRRB|nr:Helicase, C-terminal domain and P-loop containing nucleoside triphosphate hydrolase domain-containing protein [Strongyloides ratti]CEF59320.1 Helicase, C-terminal domain and P-loop containing nucleoside triphosphate hydrolase domain-containing protein [Strongyloides ratti]
MTMVKKENLLDISDYVDRIKRLQILRTNVYQGKPFRVVIIVRNIQEIQFCEDLYKKEGFTTVKYCSTLSKEEKEVARKVYEGSEYSVFITTAGNLVGVDLQTCSVILHHGLPTNISTYFQDIGRLNRGGGMAFSILYSTSHVEGSLKRILTIENFNTACRRSCSVSTVSESSYRPIPEEKRKSDINWITPKNKEEDGFEVVELGQQAFLEMLAKDTNNCLHNCYLKYLDKTYIPNCIYRCTNCLTKNSVLNERLILDAIKVYKNNKYISGDEDEKKILENYYIVRKIFMEYEEERKKKTPSPKT